MRPKLLFSIMTCGRCSVQLNHHENLLLSWKLMKLDVFCPQYSCIVTYHEMSYKDLGLRPAAKSWQFSWLFTCGFLIKDFISVPTSTEHNYVAEKICNPKPMFVWCPIFLLAMFLLHQYTGMVTISQYCVHTPWACIKFVCLPFILYRVNCCYLLFVISYHLYVQ